MKTKKEIAIWLTNKNRKKVQGILEMFGEKTYSDTTLSLTWYIEFYEGKWSSSSDDKLDEIRVKPKELRAILAKEKLKPNDVIITKGNVTVVVTETTHLGSPTFNGKYKDGKEYSINYSAFKRYATKEEIKNFDGVKELQVGKWYNFSFDDNPNYIRGIYFIDKIEDDKVWFKYGLNIDSNYWHDSEDWYNKSHIWQESTQQEVEEVLIKEAEKRGIISGATVKDEYGNTFKNINGSYVFRNNKLAYGGCIIFKDGKFVEVIQEVDKFAELKEAYNNGAIIEVKRGDGSWVDWTFKSSPYFSSDVSRYRIKTEEPQQSEDLVKPKIGDVVTNGRLFKKVREFTFISSSWRAVTQQQVIDLLFNKK